MKNLSKSRETLVIKDQKVYVLNNEDDFAEQVRNSSGLSDAEKGDEEEQNYHKYKNQVIESYYDHILSAIMTLSTI